MSPAEAEARVLALAIQIEQQRNLVEDLEFSLMEAELKVSECTPFDLTDSISDSIGSTRVEEASAGEKQGTSNFDAHMLHFDSKLTDFNSKLIEFDSTLANLGAPYAPHNDVATTQAVNGKLSNGDSQPSLTPRANSTSTVHCASHGGTMNRNNVPPATVSQTSSATVTQSDLPAIPVSAEVSQPLNGNSNTDNLSNHPQDSQPADNTCAVPAEKAANARTMNDLLSHSLDLLDDVFDSHSLSAQKDAHSISNGASRAKESETAGVQENLARLRLTEQFSGSSTCSFNVPFLDGANSSSNSSQNVALHRNSCGSAKANGSLTVHSNGNNHSNNTQLYLSVNLKQYVTEVCGHDVSTAAIREQVQVEASRVSGNMQKMGGRIKTWKRRWFVFDSARRTFSYFSAPDLRVLKGLVPFDAIEDVYFDHVRACPRRSPNSRHTFCIRTPQRTYFCVAPSLEAMRIWIDVVLTACPSFSFNRNFAIPSAQVPRIAALS